MGSAPAPAHGPLSVSGAVLHFQLPHVLSLRGFRDIHGQSDGAIWCQAAV